MNTCLYLMHFLVYKNLFILCWILNYNSKLNILCFEKKKNSYGLNFTTSFCQHLERVLRQSVGKLLFLQRRRSYLRNREDGPESCHFSLFLLFSCSCPPTNGFVYCCRSIFLCQKLLTLSWLAIIGV